MDRLFAPWRIEWVKRDERGGESEGCVFCDFVEGDDRDNLVVARSERSYVVLNNYPYNPGHVMVVPHDHTGDYAALDDDTLLDHARLKAATFKMMRRAFDPDGFNTGLNLGEGSGGSIDDHLHTHVVPRWVGDTNFLPVTSDTKVIVEAIEDSYDHLRDAFAEIEGAEIEDEAVRL